MKSALRAIKTLHPDSPVVYVDSGSSDGSVQFAQSLGITTVELDMSSPFTAARARNAGGRKLLGDCPHVELIQFLDGDCEIRPGWLEAGIKALAADDVGITSGRRAEKFPEASIYNTLMDKEWDTPIGEIMGVPGDMLVKVSVFSKLGGFNGALIAGEDFDLCIRAKQLGYKTMRVDAPMSLHDANILRFSQWYQRTRRGGHAWINLYDLHRDHAAHYFQRKILSIVIWAALFPLVLLLAVLLYFPLALVLVTIQFGMIARCALRQLRLGDDLRTACAFSVLVYIAKYPELSGMIEYWRVKAKRREHTLIEYK